MFLNLTQSAMMDVEDLGEYLHESVRSRITEKINLEIPSPDILKNYIQELLNNPVFRSGDVESNSFIPFEETVIDEILVDLRSVPLRRYNEAFSLLLEDAVFDGVETIDLNYYRQVKEEILG